MTTITLNEAIKLVPAIGASTPSSTVSKRYQFVSTQHILEQIQDKGWVITNATSQGQREHAQHRVTLVHQSNLTNLDNAEGIPRIELFNSHNRTKRLMFAIGYFRFVCSNGLIVATGPSETIRTKHNFSDDRLSTIMERVGEISDRFPSIIQKIDKFKSRELSEEEQNEFARYAIKGRFNYRPNIPKKFSNLESAANKVLSVRREEDSDNTAWAVFNRVQENIVSGIEGFSLPIKGYTDNVRVNQLLWKGTETTLSYGNQQLTEALNQLLVKDRKKAKISA